MISTDSPGKKPMCQYNPQAMPPDGVGSSVDECLHLGFSGSSSLPHGLRPHK
jgi:hypothetical protein